MIEPATVWVANACETSGSHSIDLVHCLAEPKLNQRFDKMDF